MTIEKLIHESNPVTTDQLPGPDSPLGVVIEASATQILPIARWERAMGRRPLIRLGALAAVGAGAVALALGLVGPGTQGAFAAWSAKPTIAPAGQIATAESSCLRAVVEITTRTADDGHSRRRGLATSTSAWNVVVTDTRGPFTLLGYSATTSTSADRASCLVGNGISPEVVIDWQLAGKPSPMPAGSINAPTTEWNAPDNYTVAIGMVGTGVTDLSVNLSNGTTVTTTVSNGYYAAWWPGSASAQSWEVTTSSGTSQVVALGEQGVPSTASGTSGASGTS